jgi:hypothetical protein
VANHRFRRVGRLTLRDFSRYQSSAFSLIAANVLPLFGVIFLRWDAFAIVVLYWAENVVIGGINVLKLITCSPDPELLDWSRFSKAAQSDEARRQLQRWREQGASIKLVHHGSKLFFVPFFVIHYGLFCLAHGMFLFAVFGHDPFGRFGDFSGFGRVFSEQHLWWAAIALAASHLYSFFANYIGRGEYRRTLVPLLMFQPYSRVVVLHIAILFGGFVAMALGSNIGVLVILIAGKTALDLALHLRERERNAADESADLGAILDESAAKGISS